MDYLDRNILFLDNALELPYVKKHKILKMFGSKIDLYDKFNEIGTELKQILTPYEFSLLQKSAKQNLDQIIEGYKRDNIQIVTVCDDRYPQILRDGIQPPFCLYCKGNVDLLKSICIAVVGSRKISDYGRVVTAQFTKELVGAGLTIVSGLALGVDSVAHNVCLQNQGATIAVLAGGFNHIYPTANFGLYKQICASGLVITEYPPNAEPLSYNFPVRNRIIAALSQGVLITEAGLKSGAMHTKNYAIDMGKEVFAIPGKITSSESEGTNSIIRQCQGALVTSPKDVFDILGIKLQEKTQKLSQQLDFMTTSILNYILAEKKSFQEIADFTKLSTRELNTKLMEMQMDGLIIKLAGNNYISAK